MLDFNLTEMAVVAIVALVVIGPKDLPKALRVVGYWVGKARGVARQFRAGFDEIVRESELADMEKKWQAENERIMREHPATPVIEAPANEASIIEAQPDDATDQPVMVEKPQVVAAPEPDSPELPLTRSADSRTAPADKAES